MVKALKVVHDRDPKEVIWEDVGEAVQGTAVLGANVLVAIYRRPERTAGGIILTDRSRDEDKYQGIIGMVLKMGPLAFTEDSTHQWGERTPVVGDWVMFRVGDTFQFVIDETDCRMVEDVRVFAVVDRPDLYV